MLNRSKLYAAVLLAAAFLAGAVVGGAAQAAWGDRDRRDARDGRRREHSYVDRLARDLSLSSTQRDSAVTIIEGYSVAMEQLWTEMRPRMDSLRTEIRTNIAAILTPEQQQEYRALNARSDSARAVRARGSSHERQ